MLVPGNLLSGVDCNYVTVSGLVIFALEERVILYFRQTRFIADVAVREQSSSPCFLQALLSLPRSACCPRGPVLNHCFQCFGHRFHFYLKMFNFCECDGFRLEFLLISWHLLSVKYLKPLLIFELYCLTLKINV